MSIEQKVQQTGSVVKPWVLLKLFIWLCVCKRERERQSQRERALNTLNILQEEARTEVLLEEMYLIKSEQRCCVIFSRGHGEHSSLWKRVVFCFLDLEKTIVFYWIIKISSQTFIFFFFFFIIVFSLLFSIHFKNVFRTCWWCQTASRVSPEEWMFYRFLNEENASLQCRVYDCNGTQLNLVYSSRV